MSKATLYNYSITGTSVIDELYQDVGSSTFQLGTVKRAFAGGSELSISPGDAASHYLVEGVDYELVDEDFNYTEECGFAVYTGVRILNSDYQTGDLYISYTCIGSYTDVSPILAAIAIAEGTEDLLAVLFNPSYLNLTAKLNATTPNTKVDVAWDGLRIGDRYTTSKSFTLDITQSGALGLDTGSAANSTWYYIWAICNDAGTTVSAILSASATAPTLPSGYTKKRWVSAVYRKSDGAFRAYRQLNTAIAMPIFGIATGTYSAVTEVDLTAVISQQAAAVMGYCVNLSTSGAANVYSCPPVGGVNLGRTVSYCGVGSIYSSFTRQLIIPQRVYIDAVGGGEFYITGFEVNL